MNIPFQHATPEFKLVKFPKGRPYLCMTDNGDLNNSVFNRRTSFLFQFQDGTSYAEAAAIQELLEKHVKTISVQGI